MIITTIGLWVKGLVPSEKKDKGMKLKKVISIAAVLILLLLTVLTFAAAYNTFATNPMDALGSSEDYTDGWYTKNKDGNQSFISLENLNFKGKGPVKLTIYHELPEESDSIQRALVFSTSGISFSAYINDSAISQSKVFSSETLLNKDPGYSWHFVNLPPHKDGDILRLDLYSYQYDGSEAVHEMYKGRAVVIFKSMITDSMLRMLICLILSLVGIFYMAMHVMFNKLLKIRIHMAHVGICILLGGIYSSLHLALPALFAANVEILNSAEYLLLMVIPIFLLRYIDLMCDMKNSRLIGAAYAVLIINFAAQNLLNLFTPLTFHSMLFMSHLVIMFTVYVIVRTASADRNNYEMGDTETKLRKNLLFVGLIVMFLAVIMDVFHLYFAKTQDASFFFRLGMIFFAAIVAAVNMICISDFTKRTAVSDLLRSMAYTDQLTGLSNRAQFERRLDELDAEKHEHETVAVLVFDVNDLKKVNDNYGHQEGDVLIRLAAAAISSAFVGDFLSYRIGGDEFASIYSGRESRTYIEHQIDMFFKRVENMNVSQPEHLKLSIAVGVAYMSVATSESISSVFRRADRIMYENKKEMKEHRD